MCVGVGGTLWDVGSGMWECGVVVCSLKEKGRDHVAVSVLIFIVVENRRPSNLVFWKNLKQEMTSETLSKRYAYRDPLSLLSLIQVGISSRESKYSKSSTSGRQTLPLIGIVR